MKEVPPRVTVYRAGVAICRKTRQFSTDYNYHLKQKLAGSVVKTLPTMQVTQVPHLCQEEPLEEEMATHSSILAETIPWTEVPGGPHSPGGCKESDTIEHT